eukprot:CAMPEP_0178384386 /NCGR_PEP_ID=MMETSP0689_2-20121128/7488_1 /TAXON_ID=160604 /ORGANISM="Amphidinium massartii, Strain CS-259" /LENGTH=510 /DNA_ID=CAMNT_0020004631 /DNA_START=120 /DNA_END=1653 /DNA_ORIENTATION=-
MTAGSSPPEAVNAQFEHQDRRMDKLEVEVLGLRSEVVQNRVLLGALQAQLLRLQTALANVPGLQLQLEPLLGDPDEGDKQPKESKPKAVTYNLNGGNSGGGGGLSRVAVAGRVARAHAIASTSEQAAATPHSAGRSLASGGGDAEDSVSMGNCRSCPSCGSARVRSSSVASNDSSEHTSIAATPLNSATTGSRRKGGEFKRLGSFVIRETPDKNSHNAQAQKELQVPSSGVAAAPRSWQPHFLKKEPSVRGEEQLLLGPRLSSGGVEPRVGSPKPLNASLDAIGDETVRRVSRGPSPTPPGGCGTPGTTADSAEGTPKLAATSWPARCFQARQRLSPAGSPSSVAEWPGPCRRLVSEGGQSCGGGRAALGAPGQPPPPLMNTRVAPQLLSPSSSSPGPLPLCSFKVRAASAAEQGGPGGSGLAPVPLARRSVGSKPAAAAAGPGAACHATSVPRGRPLSVPPPEVTSAAVPLRTRSTSPPLAAMCGEAAQVHYAYFRSWQGHRLDAGESF